MKGDKIIIGADTITDKNVLDGTCCLSNSLAGDALTIDTLTATVYSEDTRFFQLADVSGCLMADRAGCVMFARPRLWDPTQYAYGTPAHYYHNDVLVGGFFVAEVVRVALCHYQLYCVSGVGLLEHMLHYGGLYTGQALSAVAADILGGAVEYTIDPAWAEVPVYGWLPVATRRENLHQLLFAVGLALRKDAAGVIRIAAPSTAPPTDIPDDRVFQGGSIERRSPASGVVVTEHAFIAFDSDETTTLFAGDVAASAVTTPMGARASGTLVRFEFPVHDLAVSNGAILESGVNYAVLGPSGDCTLTGQRYTHTTREIALGVASAGSDNARVVADATLVSLANSEHVAQRTMAYYSSAKTISTDLEVGAERPGDPVRLRDPFGDPAVGTMESMDISISGLLRATATIVEGYTPTGIGNYYTKSKLFTADTVYTAVKNGKVRVVLIGGGSGGSSGASGVGGSGDMTTSTIGRGGSGGSAGAGGLGGCVGIYTIEVRAGQTYAIHVGAGGIGAVAIADGTAPGTAGGCTTFGAFSSASGRPADRGYSDLFGGAVYALTGDVGISGGAGSGAETGANIVYGGVTYHPGANGAYVSYESEKISAAGQGGGGGGAAAGAGGGPGENGSADYNGGHGYGQGGNGGDGAAGSSGAAAAAYGAGGNGGHGGGGGGAGGGGRNSNGSAYWSGGVGGTGGPGGSGGNGAPGAVIVYE